MASKGATPAQITATVSGGHSRRPVAAPTHHGRQVGTIRRLRRWFLDDDAGLLHRDRWLSTRSSSSPALALERGGCPARPDAAYPSNGAGRIRAAVSSSHAPRYGCWRHTMSRVLLSLGPAVKAAPATEDDVEVADLRGTPADGQRHGGQVWNRRTWLHPPDRIPASHPPPHP
ncbi:hypothetical protein C8T65DRAFT_273466 [Cerioporus squamosus]|nr:hypothetical protein C8T65DRAFT_273466 [Cerioporus squamosus]